jgi:hypothetical protein
VRPCCGAAGSNAKRITCSLPRRVITRVSMATSVRPPGESLPPVGEYRPSVFSRIITMSTWPGVQTCLFWPWMRCWTPS